MPSHADRQTLPVPTPQVFAIFLLLASALQIVENLVPKIPVFPWLRLGLAYIVILPFLLHFGARRTFVLFMCRNLITLIYGGHVFSAFMISSLSGLVSVLLAGQTIHHLHRRGLLGLLGACILMAAVFNMTQLLFVNAAFVSHANFYFQTAPLLLWSILSGSLTAAIISKTGPGLSVLFESPDTAAGAERDMPRHLSRREFFRLGTVLAGFGALFILRDWTLQAGFLALLLILTRFRSLRFLLLAWPFFFYLAWLHLFTTGGVYIFRDWITREGLFNFTFYACRTGNIIMLGQSAAPYIPRLWRRFSSGIYITGFSLAVPVLPSLYGISISLGKDFLRQLRKGNFENLMTPVVERLRKELKL